MLFYERFNQLEVSVLLSGESRRFMPRGPLAPGPRLLYVSLG